MKNRLPRSGTLIGWRLPDSSYFFGICHTPVSPDSDVKEKYVLIPPHPIVRSSSTNLPSTQAKKNKYGGFFAREVKSETNLKQCLDNQQSLTV